MDKRAYITIVFPKPVEYMGMGYDRLDVFVDRDPCQGKFRGPFGSSRAFPLDAVVCTECEIGKSEQT